MESWTRHSKLSHEVRFLREPGFSSCNSTHFFSCLHNVKPTLRSWTRLIAFCSCLIFFTGPCAVPVPQNLRLPRRRSVLMRRLVAGAPVFSRGLGSPGVCFLQL